jgi:hypothetical protein
MPALTALVATAAAMPALAALVAAAALPALAAATALPFLAALTFPALAISTTTSVTIPRASTATTQQWRPRAITLHCSYDTCVLRFACTDQHPQQIWTLIAPPCHCGWTPKCFLGFITINICSKANALQRIRSHVNKKRLPLKITSTQ